MWSLRQLLSFKSCVPASLFARLSSLILIVIICWRLDFVDPIPLAACYLDGHRAGYKLLQCEDGGECRDDKAKNDDCRDIKEEVLSLHQQLVITEKAQTLSRPEWQIVLLHAMDCTEVRNRLRDCPCLAALLDDFRGWVVITRIRIMVILSIFDLWPCSIWIQVRTRVSTRAKSSMCRCWCWTKGRCSNRAGFDAASIPQ